MADSSPDLSRVIVLAQEVREKEMSDFEDSNVKEFAIHRRLSKNGLFAKMCCGICCSGVSEERTAIGSRMEIGYVVRDAAKWEVDAERDASGFDDVYYGRLLENA